MVVAWLTTSVVDQCRMILKKMMMMMVEAAAVAPGVAHLVCLPSVVVMMTRTPGRCAQSND